MTAFFALLAFDVRLSFRRGADTMVVVGFFVLTVVLFSLAFRGDTALLARIAPGLVWVTALLAAMLAHNLSREMQMVGSNQQRNTTEKRAPLWQFTQLSTLRRKLIQRAGRLTKPQRKLTLTMSANPAVKSELLHYLSALNQAA